MDIGLLLGLLGLSLLVLLVEQVRVMRMPPQKRARLLDRRAFGVIKQPRDPKAYLRRFTSSMIAFLALGALIVVLAAAAADPHHARDTVTAAAVVLVVLAVFGVIGWLNYRRIAEDSDSPLARSNDPNDPW